MQSKRPAENTCGNGAVRGVVLVVDDDPSLRSLVAAIISEQGYEVITAACGPEALRIARQARVDLLLTDLMMPGMTGTELIERIRSQGAVSRFLVMSGRRDAECETGAPVLRKPFRVEELLRRIEDAIAA